MKVSIITVCYNSKEFIQHAIDSVLNQTYSNIEYIIIDGNSTDGTVDIVNSYGEKISKFVSEFVEKTGNQKDKIKKTELANQFKFWFQQEQGANKKMPKGQELYDFMDKKFGIHKTTGWQGVKILYPTTDEMEDIEN